MSIPDHPCGYGVKKYRFEVQLSDGYKVVQEAAGRNVVEAAVDVGKAIGAARYRIPRPVRIRSVDWWEQGKRDDVQT